MDWMPNEDAAVWLMREILPRVRQAVPAARLTVVGKSPSAFLRRLAAAVGQAAVTGRVDDVRPYLERARVVAVPLRVGGGTRIKIFEAMAARRPVVSTTIGAEGLPVAHGRDVLIADGDADFAEAVVQVLTDDRLAERLAGAGRELVEERFDWTQAAAAFDALLQRATSLQPSGFSPEGSRSRLSR
jgi:glycosyltransferase involved in cell wall biosynthesis